MIVAIDAREIWMHVETLRRQGRVRPEGAYEEAIGYLRAFLECELSIEERMFIYQEIASVQAGYGHLDEAEFTHEEITRLFPESPLSWIQASDFCLYVRDDPNKALLMADRAVAVAKRARCFVIHAYNTRCRAARRGENFEILNQTIKAILAQAHIAGSKDSAYECDFLAGLPDGAVDAALMRRLQRCRSPLYLVIAPTSPRFQ